MFFLKIPYNLHNDYSINITNRETHVVLFLVTIETAGSMALRFVLGEMQAKSMNGSVYQ